jgi:hypothetical protein
MAHKRFWIEGEASATVAGFDINLALSDGFLIQGSSRLQFPNGPKNLYSDLAVPSPTATAIGWRFRVSGNSAWAIGVIPESRLNVHNYFMETAPEAVLMSDQLMGGRGQRVAMHLQVVDVIADAIAETVEFIVHSPTPVRKVCRFPSEGPARLALMGFNAACVKLESAVGILGHGISSVTCFPLIKTPAPWKVGEKVKIRTVTVEEAIELQENHGGWADSMAKMIGCEGFVTGTHNGIVGVRVNGDIKHWNPELILRDDDNDARDLSAEPIAEPWQSSKWMSMKKELGKLMVILLKLDQMRRDELANSFIDIPALNSLRREFLSQVALFFAMSRQSEPSLVSLEVCTQDHE